MQTKPEDVMPWKVNGERWHLGEKGFPPGKKVQWDRALLPRLLELVREVEPDVEVQLGRAATPSRCACRASAGRGRSGGPRQAAASICRFLGKKGQFNLSRLEGLGGGVGVHRHEARGRRRAASWCFSTWSRRRRRS